MKSSSLTLDDARVHLTHNEYRKLCQFGATTSSIYGQRSTRVRERALEVEGETFEEPCGIDPEIVGWEGSVTISFGPSLG